MRVHRRQFLLGREPIRVYDDWRSSELVPGLFLSHCPDLPVALAGRRALLGIALQSEAGRPSPADLIGSITTDEIDTQAATWVGRWVLIAEDGVRTDAAATLTCAYRNDSVGCWVSSSVALLREIEPVLPHAGPVPPWGIGMDYRPMPGTGIAGVDRLLPSERLEPDGSPVPRPLPSLPEGRSVDQLIGGLVRRVVNAMQALPRDAPLTLPLSGGGDSRLVLAAAVTAGHRPSAYTFDFPESSRADRELPARLAEIAGVPHRVIAPAHEPKPEYLALYDAHSGAQISGIDRRFFAMGQFDTIRADGIDLGGGVFEVPRCYYRNFLPARRPDSAAAAAAAVVAAWPTQAKADVERWTERVYAAPDWGWGWRERLYLEQRDAGWLGSIAQSLDLFAPYRVHVGSCGAFLGEAMALPKEIRYQGLHHKKMIELLMPELAQLPINPPDSVAEVLRKRVQRERQLLSRSGDPASYVVRRVRAAARRQRCAWRTRAELSSGALSGRRPGTGRERSATAGLL